MPESRNFDTLPPVLTPDEAADLMRLDVTTVKDWMRAGKLPGAFKMGGKVWRVDRDELVKWIRAQQRTGQAQDGSE